MLAFSISASQLAMVAPVLEEERSFQHWVFATAVDSLMRAARGHACDPSAPFTQAHPLQNSMFWI